LRRRDRDPASLLFRRVVDLVETTGLTAVGFSADLGQRSRQGRLAMVDVTDGADLNRQKK
jgi:hypothetical protein